MEAGQGQMSHHLKARAKRSIKGLHRIKDQSRWKDLHLQGRELSSTLQITGTDLPL
jgi:hypothetical protein